MANKIAIAIKRANPEETGSVEVMQYALNIVLNTLLTFTVSLSLGMLLDNLKATLTFILGFNLLRVCSGGFHLKSAAACNIVSILMYVFIPSFIVVGGWMLWTMNALSLVIMLIFAPNPDKNAQVPITLFPYLKFTSVLLVVSNFWITSSVISLAFFIQSLSVISWKRRCQP